MDEATTVLGKNIRRLRKARGLAQTEMADLAGLHQYTISQLELGLREPHSRTLRKIAEVLELDVADLYGMHLPKEGAGIAPAPLQPPESFTSPDRRIVDSLDSLTKFLQQRLSSGEMSEEERDLQLETDKALAALLGPAMRAEADELRRLFPNEPDVGPRAIIGPAVLRYVQTVIEVLDEADKAEVIALDRDRRRAYGDLDKQAS